LADIIQGMEEDEFSEERDNLAPLGRLNDNFDFNRAFVDFNIGNDNDNEDD